MTTSASRTLTAPVTASAPSAASVPVAASGTPWVAGGGKASAGLLVLGSCTSLQIGAALATRLFPVTGAPGATLLRVGIAAAVLLGVTRPRVRGWRPSQWRAVGLYGISLAGT